MDRATRKLRLKKKERKVQDKLRWLLSEGDSKSSTFWRWRRKLNKIQAKIYKLSCVPMVIVNKHGKKDKP